jgi:DNA (cytosine-5)-methyltransferase 1
MKNGVLDIFCGAGGLSLGFLFEGFDIVYSSDNNLRAIETIAFNHKKIHSSRGEENYHYTETEDINNLNARKVRKIFRDRGYRVQGIIGGPPCQGFSIANKKTRTIDNPNNSLFRQYLRLIEDLNPDFIVFENVVGFLSMANGKLKEEILTTLDESGYIADSNVLSASWYGVPQIRQRVFIIGVKRNKLKKEYKKKIVFPSKTSDRPVTVNEAFSGLPKIGMGEKRETQKYLDLRSISRYVKSLRFSPEFNMISKKVFNHVTTQNNELVQERYKHIKQGENWQNLPDYLMDNYKDKTRCHSYIYRRLEENKPSITVSDFRKCMFIHPTEDRGLSVREAARLQSFPDWYEVKGELMYKQQQVACAVPPLMAQAIAKEVKSMLK